MSNATERETSNTERETIVKLLDIMFNANEGEGTVTELTELDDFMQAIHLTKNHDARTLLMSCLNNTRGEIK